MTEYALTLTTDLKPTVKFTVDGEEYELLSLDHLSPDDEAHVTALFARINNLTELLGYEQNVAKGEALSKRIKSTRLDILSTLTTLSKETADKLPLTAQVRLLERVAAETAADDGGAED